MPLGTQATLNPDIPGPTKAFFNTPWAPDSGLSGNQCSSALSHGHSSGRVLFSTSTKQGHKPVSVFVYYIQKGARDRREPYTRYGSVGRGPMGGNTSEGK